MALPVSMHGPSIVFRPAPGLQGLLGSQSVGVNPDKLAEVMQGSIDLMPFLKQGMQLQQKATSNAAAATGAEGLSATVVPAGKVWMPFAQTTEGVCAAGDTLDVTPCVSMGANVGPWIVGDPAGATATGSSGRRSIMTLEWWRQPTLFGPGCAFGWYNRLLVIATGPTVNFWFSYYEFEL